ncbi:hypothetical protein BDK51DRAFT_44622 [Blyttiomyces helicus]|uniref:Uncharacterized protein n=1 Tax=Blyttiomyces helicus TaxID=388810 RepID=A0A4P9WB32_9FUNG|nr:hypothetical protein BDK51DRAFT_44622 [Blyttiomyces helicus]|eukprot:RKO89684.1 hypothetical protein BDK51DRAFT_44622 [Blyttiomyces helicus]
MSQSLEKREKLQVADDRSADAGGLHWNRGIDDNALELEQCKQSSLDLEADQDKTRLPEETAEIGRRTIRTSSPLLPPSTLCSVTDTLLASHWGRRRAAATTTCTTVDLTVESTCCASRRRGPRPADHGHAGVHALLLEDLPPHFPAYRQVEEDWGVVGGGRASALARSQTFISGGVGAACRRVTGYPLSIHFVEEKKKPPKRSFLISPRWKAARNAVGMNPSTRVIPPFHSRPRYAPGRMGDGVEGVVKAACASREFLGRKESRSPA